MVPRVYLLKDPDEFPVYLQLIVWDVYEVPALTLLLQLCYPDAPLIWHNLL